MSGLEAIGVAASIIQVADLGATLSVKLFSFYQRVKNASDSIQILSNEIALVSAILRELGDNFKEEEASKLCSDKAYRTLSAVLNQSRDVLGQIQKVIENNDQRGKGRFQQVTGKFRIVLQEPNLDHLRMSLERLKSTMLLLLNVITYAGQIRSNNVPSLVQEQHDFLQILFNENMIGRPKPRGTAATGDGPREVSMETLPDQPNQAGSHTGFNLNSMPDGSFRQPSSGNQTLHPPSDPWHNRIPDSKEYNESAELSEYNSLIRSMLVEIETCKSKLEKKRYSRIKEGVLNIHSGEIMRFQMERGHAVPIDLSLFAQLPETKPIEMTEERRARPRSPEFSGAGVYLHDQRDSDRPSVYSRSMSPPQRGEKRGSRARPDQRSNETVNNDSGERQRPTVILASGDQRTRREEHHRRSDVDEIRPAPGGRSRDEERQRTRREMWRNRSQSPVIAEDLEVRVRHDEEKPDRDERDTRSASTAAQPRVSGEMIYDLPIRRRRMAMASSMESRQDEDEDKWSEARIDRKERRRRIEERLRRLEEYDCKMRSDSESPVGDEKEDPTWRFNKSEEESLRPEETQRPVLVSARHKELQWKYDGVELAPSANSVEIAPFLKLPRVYPPKQDAIDDLALPESLESLLAEWTTLDEYEIQRGALMEF